MTCYEERDELLVMKIMIADRALGLGEGADVFLRRGLERLCVVPREAFRDGGGPERDDEEVSELPA